MQPIVATTRSPTQHPPFPWTSAKSVSGPSMDKTATSLRVATPVISALTQSPWSSENGKRSSRLDIRTIFDILQIWIHEQKKNETPLSVEPLSNENKSATLYCINMLNRYPGKCNACGNIVAPNTGKLERKGNFYSRGRQSWILWCMSCFNTSDCSGEEDRCCGNRAYENRCSQMVGGDYQAGW